MQHERLLQGMRELYLRTTVATRALEKHTSCAVDRHTISPPSRTIYGILDSLGILNKDIIQSKLGTIECASCGQCVTSSSYWHSFTTNSDISPSPLHGVNDTLEDAGPLDAATSVTPSDGLPSPRQSPPRLLEEGLVGAYETSQNVPTDILAGSVVASMIPASVDMLRAASAPILEYPQPYIVDTLDWMHSDAWSNLPAQQDFETLFPDQYYAMEDESSMWS